MMRNERRSQRAIYDLLCKMDREKYEPSPEERAVLSAQRVLNLSRLPIQELPKTIGELKWLKRLNLSSTGITSLPDSVGELSKLYSLDLSYTNISALPESLGKLTDLHSFSLLGTKVDILPDSIGNLKELTKLNLSGTNIISLPKTVGKLSQLKTLNLSNSPITSLPEEIGNLTQLHNLNLWKTKISALPQSFGQLSGLHRLYLGHSPIESLPKSFGKLKNLQLLHLGGTKITTLPESFGSLSNLRTVDLSGTPLQNLPNSFENLSRLQALNLGETAITILPDYIGKLSCLKTLQLGCTSITSLPESIGKLTGLKTLDLDSTRITKLTESIGGLTGLGTLYLCKTSLSFLPDSFTQLKSLKSLDLSETNFTSLPKSIRELSSLEDLTIGGTQISELPEWLAEMKNLQKLYLWGTNIVELPDWIGNLIQLRTLSVHKTPIATLPDSISKLSNLQSLGLGGTRITSLPEWIGNLPKLRRLVISGLTISSIPESLALLGLPFVDSEVFHYTSNGINIWNTIIKEQDRSVFLETPELIPSLYEKEVLIPARECRILFLGDGDSGKTYTIRRIMNECRKETVENTYPTCETPGVEIVDYRVEKGEDSFDIHFWDFGGQEILHSMHRCFLSDKTCYVVTVKSRETKATKRARYWLRNITAFAPHSPILLYINCWDHDDGKRAIDEVMLRQDYPNIVDVVYISAKESDDTVFRAELLEKLVQLASTSESCKKMVNLHWDAVRKAIIEESRAKHYLTRDNYTKLCEANSIPQRQAPALLEFFNILGVCFSYHWDENRNELVDYKLLNPVWLTNAIYAVIEEGMAHAHEGQISVLSVQQMLGNRAPDELVNRDIAGDENCKPYRRTMPEIVYNQDECRYVIDVAAARNLCYVVDERTLFFPALCTNNTPVEAITGLESFPHHIEYLLKYEYLPDSVVHQLIIRSLKADLSVNHCWLRGMVLGSMNAHKAIVRMDDDERLRIEIHSRMGHPPYELFELLRKEILTVNEQLNLKATEYVIDGNDQYSLIMLYRAAKGVGIVYGPTTGKERKADDLLGRFYEDWTVKLMRVEENGVITIPILPRKYHECKKDNQKFRRALYEAYNEICPYCKRHISSIREMEVDHILPKDQKQLNDLPELNDYIEYLNRRGFHTDRPDYVENFFPAHGECNRDKLNHIDIYTLLARHEISAGKASKVLRLMEKYKNVDKE